MKYSSFDNWFMEIENYGLRAERFYEEFPNMKPERAVEWLRAAWLCSRQDDVRDQFEKESG